MPPHDPRLLHAVRCLQQGGVISHATEGVWALACNPNNADAIKRLLQLKGRPSTKGFILVAAGKDMFLPWLNDLPAANRTQIESCWPGPVTWVVPDNGRSSALIRGAQNNLAIRVPDHAQTQHLSRLFGGPIVSTSANPSGCLAARSEADVHEYFADQIDYVLTADQNTDTPLSGKASIIKDALMLTTLRH